MSRCIPEHTDRVGSIRQTPPAACQNHEIERARWTEQVMIAEPLWEYEVILDIGISMNQYYDMLSKLRGLPVTKQYIIGGHKMP